MGGDDDRRWQARWPPFVANSSSPTSATINAIGPDAERASGILRRARTPQAGEFLVTRVIAAAFDVAGGETRTAVNGSTNSVRRANMLKVEHYLCNLPPSSLNARQR